MNIQEISIKNPPEEHAGFVMHLKRLTADVVQIYCVNYSFNLNVYEVSLCPFEKDRKKGEVYAIFSVNKNAPQLLEAHVIEATHKLRDFCSSQEGD